MTSFRHRKKEKWKMRVYIQCKELKDYFGVVKAHVDEGINQITMIDLELAGRVTIKPPDLEKLIGKPITLVVEDIINNTAHKVRWDGFIFEMIDITGGNADNDTFYYTMVVRPKLWLLNYYTNCRSYPEMSRIQVIDDLLKDHGFSENTHYTKSYQKEDVYPAFNQLLQTGNSDLSFFRSLLTNAGINFYFSCDEDGQKEEMIHLVDAPAFFPNNNDDIPIVNSAGLMQTERRIEEITRLVRAVPGEVDATAFLADGSTRPKAQTKQVDNAGTEGVVNLFVPEGLQDADKTATQAGKVVADGFTAARITYQGSADHIRVRPGRRLSLKDTVSLKTCKVLVTKAHHTFEQTVLAALSEDGTGDPAYRNFFFAAEPMAPIRPVDTWTDVDDQMILDSALDLDPNGKPSMSPKFKNVSKFNFNPDNIPEQNTEALKELMATVAMLQSQVRVLRNRVQSLESAASSTGSGLVVAEITKDAWVTEGKELVCMVKAEEFEKPIRVKTSAAWHDQGGGMLHLPRKGNHVWIQRIHRSKGNDWVIVGYRPTGKVVSSNDPSKKFSFKKFS
jgi:hypothetical protein